MDMDAIRKERLLLFSCILVVSHSHVLNRGESYILLPFGYSITFLFLFDITFEQKKLNRSYYAIAYLKKTLSVKL